MKYNTMRLTEAPEESATNTRKAWDALFETFGFATFHPLEARGVLMHAFGIPEVPPVRSQTDAILQNLIVGGFAISP